MPIFVKWTLIFTIYSFLGWVCESIYCSILGHKLVNRGFLNGPFCPVYGFGGILVVTILEPLKINVLLVFLAGVVSTSILEYLTGYLLEKLFHTKWWDYSDQRFQIHGRVCLTNSFYFGIMSVVATYLLHPIVVHLISLLPNITAVVLASSLLIWFVADTTLTVITILRLNGKVAELQQILDELRDRTETVRTEYLREVQEKLEDFLDNMDTSYRSRMQTLKARQEKLENESYLLQRRILDAFPQMASIRYNESLSRLKKSIRLPRALPHRKKDSAENSKQEK